MTVDTAWTAAPVDESISQDDAAAIRGCLLDYFEGWFDGDADRMDRALHPGLAKQALDQGPTRSDGLNRTTVGWRITGTVWQWASGHGPRA